MNIGPNHPSGRPGQGGGGGRRNRRNRRGKRGPGQPQQNKKQQPRQQQSSPGIYTAPMDHSYRAALQSDGQRGNGRQRGRAGFGGKQYLHPDPEPLPARTDENAPTRIFAYVDDLFFLAKIQEVSRKLNVKVEFVKTDRDILDRLEADGAAKPSLVIIDLNNVSIKPLSLVSKLKSKLKKETNVIGFLSHVQGELKMKAIEAGCDMVVPRSAFSQNLPQLLRRHGAPDDQEDIA